MDYSPGSVESSADEQALQAVRGMKDLLQRVNPKEERQSKFDEAASVGVVKPTVNAHEFLNLLSGKGILDVQSVTNSRNQDNYMRDDEISVLQDKVRSELWDDMVSIDLLNRQVDRNLGLYSDLFEEWHAEKALKKAVQGMVVHKCLRAWRQWTKMTLTVCEGSKLMDYKKFQWWRSVGLCVCVITQRLI